MPQQRTTRSTTQNFRDIVLKMDGNAEWYKAAHYPVAYEFTNRDFRDPGPGRGLYDGDYPQ